jgi:hypothetical protein
VNTTKWHKVFKAIQCLGNTAISHENTGERQFDC